jgi:hypothetical protein
VNGGTNNLLIGLAQTVLHHLVRISAAERDHRREDLPAAEIWDLVVHRDGR